MSGGIGAVCPQRLLLSGAHVGWLSSMKGRACWYLFLAGPVAAAASAMTLRSITYIRGVSCSGDRRPERAGEIACGGGKTKVGVHAGELPARRAAKREILACDLLIEGLRGRTHGRRRRQQGGAVGNRLFRQIALENAPPYFRHASHLVRDARAGAEGRASRRREAEREERNPQPCHWRFACQSVRTDAQYARRAARNRDGRIGTGSRRW